MPIRFCKTWQEVCLLYGGCVWKWQRWRIGGAPFSGAGGAQHTQNRRALRLAGWLGRAVAERQPLDLTIVEEFANAVLELGQLSFEQYMTDLFAALPQKTCSFRDR
jgi:hypothetical protein